MLLVTRTTMLFVCKFSRFCIALLFSTVCVFINNLYFFFNFRDLGNSNISGSLGSELGELKHLQYLYFLTTLSSVYFNPYFIWLWSCFLILSVGSFFSMLFLVRLLTFYRENFKLLACNFRKSIF